MAGIEHVSNEKEVARYGCVYHRNSTVVIESKTDVFDGFGADDDIAS